MRSRVNFNDEEYIKKRKDWWIKGSELVFKAKYKEAVEYCEKGMSLFPNDVIVKFRYHAILCDFLIGENKMDSDEFRESTQQLKFCLTQTKGHPLWVKVHMKNEYYFMTRQYLKQYKLGDEIYAVTKDAHDLYSSGVGAANYALNLAIRKKTQSAFKWAERAVIAWEKYHSVQPDYYNSYVHYSLALGILGREDEMNKALEKSAQLSGKDENYREFVWVREEIKNLIDKNLI